MTVREKTFREVGGLMWLAGISSFEVFDRASALSRSELTAAVLEGYFDCLSRDFAQAPVDEWWVRK